MSIKEYLHVVFPQDGEIYTCEEVATESIKEGTYVFSTRLRAWFKHHPLTPFDHRWITVHKEDVPSTYLTHILLLNL